MLLLNKKSRESLARTGTDSRFLTKGGFTLLEVLLAFFIFSILFVTVYASYSGSFKTITMTEKRMDLYHKAAIALERISEDLQASYITPVLETQRDVEGYSSFQGTDGEIGGRDADTLSFFTRIQPLFGSENEAVSGQVVSYTLIQGMEEDELMLLRSENPEFIDESRVREGMDLLDGLQAINFTYFDDNGEVHDSWNSVSGEYRGRLPRMVTVALEFPNDDDPEAPFTFMTSVALPVKYTSPGQE